MPRRKRPWWRPTPERWTLIFLAVGVVRRLVRYGLGFPIWGDEAFVACNLMGGSGELPSAAKYPVAAPPLWLEAERLTARVGGYSEPVLRFLPVVAGTASLFLFASLARRVLPRHWALAALAIFAVSFYPMRHAVEVKPYSFDLVVALVLLHLALTASARPDVRSFVAFAIAAAVGVWLSYPSVFVAGGALLVMAWSAWRTRRKSMALGVVATGLLLVGSFLAMYGLAARGQEDASFVAYWAYAFPPWKEPLRLLGWLLRTHTGFLFAYPNGGRNGESVVTSLLVVIGCVALWRRSRKGLVLLLLSPLPLMFIAAVLKKYPYGGSARIAQHFAPAVCLLAGAGLVAGLRRLRPRARVKTYRIVLFLFAASTLAGVRDFVHPYKTSGDLEAERAIRKLARDAGERDRWVVYGSFGAGPAPDLNRRGGEVARFVYQTARHAPVACLWGPAPEELAPTDGRTWLLVFGSPGDAARPRRDAYLERVEARLGPGEQRRFGMSDGYDLIVYVFK